MLYTPQYKKQRVKKHLYNFRTDKRETMKSRYQKWIILGSSGVVMGTTMMLLGYLLPGLFIWLGAAIFLVILFLKMGYSPKQ